MRPNLSEVIERRLISGDSELVSTEDELVRAIDVVGRFAAMYRFSMDENGDWYDDSTLAIKTSGRQWLAAGSGGSYGVGCEVPWRPSMETLGGHTVAIFGSAGSEQEDERGELVFVRTLFGFVDGSVGSLRACSANGERTLAVDSPAGAFVVLVMGESAVELQGIDLAGNHVGQPATSDPI